MNDLRPVILPPVNDFEYFANDPQSKISVESNQSVENEYNNSPDTGMTTPKFWELASEQSFGYDADKRYRSFTNELQAKNTKDYIRHFQN